jgi:hypothetical protein
VTEERSGPAGSGGPALARDAALVLAWFLTLGVLGALLWWQVTPLAEYTRTAQSAAMDEEQLGRQVSTDGWFFTIAAVGGLVSGVALLAIRKRDPLAMVVLVTLGAGLASGVMALVGLWLGPEAPKEVLASVPVGGKVPLQLELHATGVLFVWPITALLGAVGVIWGLDERRTVDDEVADPAVSGATSG